MNNQITDNTDNNDVLVRQAAVALLVCVAIVSLVILGVRQVNAADPYVQEVMALQGDEVRGHAIFQMNCASCHGLEADGEVGPSLRGVSEHRSQHALIQQVISGKTPPMPQFQPSSQDMADLLRYLDSL